MLEVSDSVSQSLTTLCLKVLHYNIIVLLILNWLLIVALYGNKKLQQCVNPKKLQKKFYISRHYNKTPTDNYYTVISVSMLTYSDI